MKNKITIVCLITMFFIAGFKSFTHEADDNFYFNPLLLDGKAMNLEKLSVTTTGKLSVVTLDVNSDKKAFVPFTVYLKRNGKILNQKSNAHNQSLNEIEIGPIMKTAMAGDELVIELANSNDKRWPRVITVNPAKVYPRIDWFYQFNKGLAGNKIGDGC